MEKPVLSTPHMTLSLSLVRGICSAMAALSLLLSGCATVSPGNQATNTDAPGSNAGSLFSFLPKGTAARA
jgi:hypothetical protein